MSSLSSVSRPRAFCFEIAASEGHTDQSVRLERGGPMEEETNFSTVELMLSYFVMAHNKNHTLKKLLELEDWQRFCSDPRKAPHMFECFQKFFHLGRCDGSVVKIFLETCGHHLADWALHDGPLDALRLLLHHAHLADYRLWRKRQSPRCSKPDWHPVNQSLYCGKMRNVDVLLNGGFNLEFTNVYYERLQKEVIHKLVNTSHQLPCLKKLRKMPNRKRIFLVLVVMRTYLFEDQFPRTFTGCDAALKAIWLYSPASYLCKDEFMDLFDPFQANFSKLGQIYNRYARAVCEGNLTGVHQPKTLAHHCRCSVRQVLGRNLAVPSGVNFLPIPKEVKNYLLYR